MDGYVGRIAEYVQARTGRPVHIANVSDGTSADHPEVVVARDAFASGPIVRALLHDRVERVYAKWRGAFWRPTAQVELGVPAGQTPALAYLDRVLAWLDDIERRGYPPLVAGLPPARAVWHGHALAAAVALDWPDALVQWRWPDGGWNCDRGPDASCSSVHESLGPLWAWRPSLALTAIPAPAGSNGRASCSSSGGCSGHAERAR